MNYTEKYQNALQQPPADTIWSRGIDVQRMCLRLQRLEELLRAAPDFNEAAWLEYRDETLHSADPKAYADAMADDADLLLDYNEYWDES